jgi:hypothetical protein
MEHPVFVQLSAESSHWTFVLCCESPCERYMASAASAPIDLNPDGEGGSLSFFVCGA